MTDEPPWYAEYDAFGVDHSLEPYPDYPLHQFLYDAADQYPDQGIVQSGRHVGYEELREDVDALAAALQERGIEKGDRVATVLPTSAQFVVATHAISRAGAVHIPNDFLDADEDLVYRLEGGDPDVLIGQNKHRELLERLQEAADVDHLILTDLDDYAENPPEHDSEAGVEWWPAVLDDADNPDPVDIDPGDTHTLLFTGGTTGKPKGCLLTHRNLVANAKQAIAAQSRLPDLMRGRESAVLALPAYHSYGYTIANMLVSLGLDLLVVPDARDTELMREHIAEYDPLVMFGVPTQFMEIADEELEHDVIGLSGSAPLAEETKERFSEQSTGMSQGYGLSEMSPITHFNVAGIQEAVMGDAASTDDAGYDQPTIGVPVPDTEVKLRDVEDDEEIPLDEAVAEEREGEMLVNGPQRMKGYLDTTDPFDEEGFVATGDVAKVDEKGRFYIVDRVKNMINVSGLKVYAEEVDEELFGMDGVRRPATVGVPDPDRPGSERVKIFVEAEDGADISAADVRSYLDGRVPRQAMPDEVEFVAEIPLTDIGKTDREALKNREN
ncbi:acyl--CoA ligase [Natronomonas halophila]|uniref:AMP-binding protein n=1 Tax=Natronomonas halophila TaxID=2747817 RepID=UPI0015B46C6F|nr:class I adenylate-forming enzyme family protein [Natronomonas halophila]QLD85641.1 acyl--CoA ligase [Natronomonas halophila]